MSTESTAQLSTSLRTAKGHITKVGKDIASLESVECEHLDPIRVARTLDSLRKYSETVEGLLETIRDGDPSLDTSCDAQLMEHRRIYQKHYETLIALKHRQAAVDLLAQLTGALDMLELHCGSSYSPSTSYDLDHASTLSHRVTEARSKVGVRGCSELLRQGSECTDRLRVLMQRRADYLAAVSIPTMAPVHAPAPKINALKLDLPTFDGRLEKWHGFWKLLSALFDQHPELTPEAKQAHIIKQMGTTECREKAEAAFEFTADYASGVARLRSDFEKPRALMKHYVKTLTSLGKYKNRQSEIISLADSLERCVAGMKKIGVFTASQLVSTMAITSMEPELLAHWGKATETQGEPPGIEYLVTFLRRHAESVPSDIREESGRPKRHVKQEKSVMQVQERAAYRERSPSPSMSHSSFNNSVKCPCCQSNHFIYACVQFKRLSCRERRDLAKSRDLCYNCLSVSHRAMECRSRNSCRVCSERHHSLLHEDQPNETPDASVKVTNGKSTVTTHCTVPRTAMVEVLSHNICQLGRVQFDSGAEVSLITRRFATQMRAKRVPNSSTTVGGVGGSFVSPYQVTLTLRGREGELMNVRFRLVDHLAVSGSTPDMNEVFSLPFLHGLTLADARYRPASPRCSRGNLLSSPDRYLQAEDTIFGWTVSGRHEGTSPRLRQPPQVLTVVASDPPLEDAIQLLWEREEFPSDIDNPSSQTDQALSQFRDTVQRESDGTYSVSLPKKMPAIELGESRSLALRRTLSTERSHQRRGDGEKYQTAAREYAVLGHAELIPPSEIHNSCKFHFYLPIHAVHKPSSSSTKFRLVFDASAKSANGVALNDILLPGPSVCSSLTSTLLRFCSHRHGMTSDITKMFRGVKLNPPDRDYHRFFLRDERGRLEEWRMNRVTFGVTSSPFLASQVLREIADEYQEEYPEAARTI